MKTQTLFSHCIAAVFLLGTGVATAEELPAPVTNAPPTLTLDQCLSLAYKQNPTIRKAQLELERTRGLIVEVRGQALPQLSANGDIRRVDENFIETYPGSAGGPTENQQQPWAATVEVSQLVYSGGRVRAAVRAAKLTDQIAVLDVARTVADITLDVRRAFYLVLLSAELVKVGEQNLALTEQQLADTKHRFDVGAVPQFNVLRAEVAVANAKPPLIRLRNDLRLSKQLLARLLGMDAPVGTLDFTSYNFVGDFVREARDRQLDTALAQAIAQRPELQQAEKRLRIRQEQITIAKAGYQPELNVFAGYGVRDTTFGSQLDDTLNGWSVGARAKWDIWDGMQTKGQVQQARAESEKAEVDVADTRRAVEFEVRRSFSDFQRATELLQAQGKVVGQAEESLRLATARFNAGSSTQLDVLDAQTALTEARANNVRAAHDYSITLAELARAIGESVRLGE